MGVTFNQIIVQEKTRFCEHNQIRQLYYVLWNIYKKQQHLFLQKKKYLARIQHVQLR